MQIVLAEYHLVLCFGNIFWHITNIKPTISALPYWSKISILFQAVSRKTKKKILRECPNLVWGKQMPKNKIFREPQQTYKNVGPDFALLANTLAHWSNFLVWKNIQLKWTLF